MNTSAKFSTWFPPSSEDPESVRLEEDSQRLKNWKRWGPYLSERQWGTVREDYSHDGNCWDYFSHDQARSRSYRWGEDGLLGITDRECRLCFGIALWNEKDPILKERLFGLTGPEGNHGEDVKEQYFYLDSTPTHSYMKGLYKYPQSAYPYESLVNVNKSRSRDETEYEINDTGVFNDNKYWDIEAEYAKNTPNDVLIKLNITNRNQNEDKVIHILPTFWYRNTWIWGCDHEGCWMKPHIGMHPSVDGRLVTTHESLGKMQMSVNTMESSRDKLSKYLVKSPEWIFTDNETNQQKLFNSPNVSKYVKDAFHRYVIHEDKEAINPKKHGTKVAAYHVIKVPAKETVTIRLRLSSEDELINVNDPFGEEFDNTFTKRINEMNTFYNRRIPSTLSNDEKAIVTQSFAGLLWSKQFYHYIVKDWLDGDPEMPPPPDSRQHARNAEWGHLFNRDIISMPDKWEYPWYASWDLAFHMVAFSLVDPYFAKNQLLLILREWYMHPNGSLPAYEFNFSDVNPPVHAWATWRVYKASGTKGNRDREFLSKAFHKLLINFTWWVNRKDINGNHIFAGGFLGLDNIGIFDRSKPLPTGGHLEQADGTAWMGSYCIIMLKIALELANYDKSYEDVASKFFEHFVNIADAMNSLGGTGLWNEKDGFYYDEIKLNGTQSLPLPVRSLVGVVPFFAVGNLPNYLMAKTEGFNKRTRWFLEHRKDLAKQISLLQKSGESCNLELYLLAIPNKERMERVLRYLFDENEFLSKYGIRSLSKYHKDHPVDMRFENESYRVDYVPGESSTPLFGGNSNWRGPIWFPMNFLLIEALQRFHNFYGDSYKIEFPTGSGNLVTLGEASRQLMERLVSLFLPDKETGKRPCHGDDPLFASDPHWKELILFYEYFHGDTGRGLGASHQTGWTALVACFLYEIGQTRMSAEK